MKDGFNVGYVVDSKMVKEGRTTFLELDIIIGVYETIKERFYMSGESIERMKHTDEKLNELANAVGLREMPENINKIFDIPFIYVHPFRIYKYMPRRMRKGL